MIRWVARVGRADAYITLNPIESLRHHSTPHTNIQSDHYDNPYSGKVQNILNDLGGEL